MFAWSEKRKKLALGACIVLVTFAITLTLISSSAARCELGSDPPARSDYRLATIASRDNSAVARFAGYLKYRLADLHDPNVYLPIELTKLDAHTVHGNATSQTQLLTMSTDCAQLELELITDLHQTVVDRMHLELVRPNGEALICTINKPVIQFAEDKRYYCPHKRAFDCKLRDPGDVVVTLIMDEIELQINSEAPSAHFTKPRETCSYESVNNA